jgi:hypothetical protein
MGSRYFESQHEAIDDAEVDDFERDDLSEALEDFMDAADRDHCEDDWGDPPPS